GGNARAGERASGNRGSFAFLNYVGSRRSVAAPAPSPGHCAHRYSRSPVTNAAPFPPGGATPDETAPVAVWGRIHLLRCRLMRRHRGKRAIDGDLYQRHSSLVVEQAAHPLAADVENVVDGVIKSAVAAGRACDQAVAQELHRLRVAQNGGIAQLIEETENRELVGIGLHGGYLSGSSAGMPPANHLLLSKLYHVVG